jgi:hypothetical protein
MTPRTAACVALVALSFACTSPTTKNNGSTADSGTPDAGTPDSGLSSPCPATSPEDRDPCEDEGLACEYGDDPRESCRAVAECTSGVWTIAWPNCDELPAAECPATREDAAGEPCEPQDAICTYDGLHCTCTNCTSGPVGQSCEGDPIWHCQAPNTEPGCPQAKPRLGGACTGDTKCTYACGGDGARTCRDGVWTSDEGGPCPISTIRAKRDVRYLSDADLASISDDVQSIRLARWRYRDPSLGRGDKLGFIIEDLPAASPAVDRERLMVNLYGYASMLVADAQARQKRIEELEARLEKLERRLGDSGGDKQ